MPVIGKRAFSKKYSEEITKYLNDDYHIVIPFGGMRTYSSALSYTDLMNDKDRTHVTRVWVIDGSTRIGGSYCNTVSIVVRKCKCPSESYYTLWPDDGECISRKDYYIIEGHDGKRAYTDSAEEAVECIEKRRVRIENKKKYEQDKREIDLKKLSPDFIDNLMERVNQLQGFKKATSLCINRVFLYLENDYRDGRTQRLMARVELYFNGKHRSFWYR